MADCIQSEPSLKTTPKQIEEFYIKVKTDLLCKKEKMSHLTKKKSDDEIKECIFYPIINRAFSIGSKYASNSSIIKQSSTANASSYSTQTGKLSNRQSSAKYEKFLNTTQPQQSIFNPFETHFHQLAESTSEVSVKQGKGTLNSNNKSNIRMTQSAIHSNQATNRSVYDTLGYKNSSDENSHVASFNGTDQSKLNVLKEKHLDVNKVQSKQIKKCTNTKKATQATQAKHKGYLDIYRSKKNN